MSQPKTMAEWEARNPEPADISSREHAAWDRARTRFHRSQLDRTALTAERTLERRRGEE